MELLLKAARQMCVQRIMILHGQSLPMERRLRFHNALRAAPLARLGNIERNLMEGFLS